MISLLIGRWVVKEEKATCLDAHTDGNSPGEEHLKLLSFEKRQRERERYERWLCALWFIIYKHRVDFVRRVSVSNF